MTDEAVEWMVIGACSRGRSAHPMVGRVVLDEEPRAGRIVAIVFVR